MEILYGLPHQDVGRLAETVQQVLSLGRDRVALSGYAHVPRLVRRQRVIAPDALPRPEARLKLFETGRRLLRWDGYVEIGHDHFVRPGDGLEVASRLARLRRSFQGYTDDPCETLIGIGASAISRFAQGYAQNAPSTSAYLAAIRAGRLATERGHAFAGDDVLRARMIEGLMCHFAVDLDALAAASARPEAEARALAEGLLPLFADVLSLDGARLSIRPQGRALIRLIAQALDAYGPGGPGGAADSQAV